MGRGFPLLQEQDGAPDLHTQMVWFATALAKCRGCSKLGIRAGRPWLLIEMVGESQLKNFIIYITGLNHLMELFNLLDHRLRIWVWYQVKPKSSQY